MAKAFFSLEFLYNNGASTKLHNIGNYRDLSI